VEQTILSRIIGRYVRLQGILHDDSKTVFAFVSRRVDSVGTAHPPIDNQHDYHAADRYQALRSFD